MNDQPLVRQTERHDLQFDTPVVKSDPDQPRIRHLRRRHRHQIDRLDDRRTRVTMSDMVDDLW